MEIIEDVRQHRKVRHNIKDILMLQLRWQKLLDSNEGKS